MLLLLILPLVIYKFLFMSKDVIPLIGMTIAGIFLGYVLSRGNFGFAGPIKKIVQQGDGRQAKALIILFMITSVIAGFAMVIFPANTHVFDYPILNKMGWGVIIGGLIFGAGMMIATGCASGTLSDVGDGQVPAFLVLIFFMIGSVFGVATYGTAFDNNFLHDRQNNSLIYLTGSVWMGVIINLLLLSFFLIIVIYIHKYKATKKVQVLAKLDINLHEFQNSEISSNSWKSIFTYENIFVKGFSWMIVVFAIVIWFLITVLAFKKTPGITSAYAKWGIYLTHGFGIKHVLNWQPYTSFHIMSDVQSWQNIGIIVGAMVAKLFANKFKFTNYKENKIYNWVLYMFGGILMGLGARFARGCNFGAMFTGVSFGTLQGWLFTIFLIAGGICGSYLIVRIKHNCPTDAYEAQKIRKMMNKNNK